MPVILKVSQSRSAWQVITVLCILITEGQLTSFKLYYLTSNNTTMKLLKLLALIIVPILCAILFGHAISSIGLNFNFWDASINYIPFICALSFFAFLGFFVMTANVVYPTRYNTTQDVVTYTQPCIYSITKC